jgi:tetratricopeptide (TPR) repeat protein
MLLSVCLVTRNEEKKIERALRSVTPLADEVVVADTGSTDRTVAVAEGLGAKVFPFKWADDFSAASNFALDQARGEWVLWLNPDEEVLPVSREHVSALLNAKDVFAYSLRVRQQLRADQPDYGTETAHIRLFRRTPEVRYRGRLHTNFAVPLAELAARQGQKTLPAEEIVIRRHAYLSQPTPDKLRWAARLLEAELRDRPGQLHYLIEYGRTLLWLNDPKGHSVLAEAVQQLRPALGQATPPTANVGLLLEYLLTVSPEQSHSDMTRAEAHDLGRRWFPRTPPVVWAQATERYAAGDYRSAAALLELLLDMGRTGAYDRSANFSPDILGESALMNLGACYLQVGELDAAERCFGQVLNSPTAREEARRGYARVQALRKSAKAGTPPQASSSNEGGARA